MLRRYIIQGKGRIRIAGCPADRLCALEGMPMNYTAKLKQQIILPI